MRKFIIYFILVLLIALIGWFYVVENKKDKTEIKEQKAKIELLMKKRDSLTDRIALLTEERDKIVYEQKFYETQVDSLQEILDRLPTNTPCEHELVLTQDQNESLKGALKKCKEAQVLDYKVAEGYAEMVINHEVTCPEEIKLAKKEEEKKGKFWKILAAVGWGLAVALAI